MPDLQANINLWNEYYNWSDEGEEWSQAWGNSEAQWFCCIYPRVHRYLPCHSVLEIAPGYGRWTRFLLNQCHTFTGVDISEKCITQCQNKFKRKNVRFVKNDGKSLDFLDDNSIDFIFSFDSLVHAEKDVMEAYIQQCLCKLNECGVAFIHHSNLSSIPHLANLVPSEKTHWRALSVSAELIRSYVTRNDGFIISQELVNWGGNHLIDCFSTFSRSSQFTAEVGCLENYDFMTEASLVKKLQPLYWPAKKSNQSPRQLIAENSTSSKGIRAGTERY